MVIQPTTTQHEACSQVTDNDVNKLLCANERCLTNGNVNRCANSEKIFPIVQAVTVILSVLLLAGEVQTIQDRSSFLVSCSKPAKETSKESSVTAVTCGCMQVTLIWMLMSTVSAFETEWVNPTCLSS